MGEKLLIRLYYVGVGDCMYIRIPDGNETFNILIDCGSLGDESLLEAAISNLKTLLPTIDGTNDKRLDLLVATHKHKDHIRGFDPSYFQGIKIKNIWLSAVMNEKHTQAKLSQQLHQTTKGLVEEFIESGQSLSPELREFAALNNDDAVTALKVNLPSANGILPTYVYAGMDNKHKDINITFSESTTKLNVLGPENNIDRFYLGVEGAQALAGVNTFSALLNAKAQNAKKVWPHNISKSDFRALQKRILSNPMAFAETDSSIQNNCSVVVLIEWRGKRLLFVGDAEWEGEYKDGKHNGSWNVMWNKRKKFLNKPLDFLKIGHHGSVNATPYRKDRDNTYEVNQILDAILPKPTSGNKATAQAVASTLRANYKTIPNPDLLIELANRVSNTKIYGNLLKENEIPKFVNEKDLLNNPQPLRTGLENILEQKSRRRNKRHWIDVEIKE